MWWSSVRPRLHSWSSFDLIDRISIRDIGDVQVGLAVAASSASCQRSSRNVEATLLAVKSIAYADLARGATAGAHFIGAERWACAEQLAAHIASPCCRSALQ